MKTVDSFPIYSIVFVHKIASFLGRWEALIDELEVVVEESLLLLESVIFTGEELINFD